METASSGAIAADEFIPLPCCHANCFALVHLVRVGARGYVPIKRFVDGGRYADLIKNKSLFGADEESFGEIRDLIFDLWADDSCGEGECACQRDLRREALASIKATVKEMQVDAGDSKRMFGRAKRRIKSVYVHHFMDADTFDLTRLRRCCTVYAKPDGRVYPMCAWNNLHRGVYGAANVNPGSGVHDPGGVQGQGPCA